MTPFKFLPAMLAQHIAIVGKTGSGKTSTAKLLVEQVAGTGSRVCVLDPIKSDWWGITSSADGKRAGLPFHILGGPHGHVPLHSSAGAAIGELVASGSLPLSIIDMANFEPGGHSRFFVDFAQVLLQKTRGVVYLVLEEAHIFAPKERSGLGNENMAIHFAKMLSTAGRSKGLRMMVLTQRTQALHNALLGSCDTLVAQRFTAPADQEPIIKWLKANVDKEVREQVERSLSSLPTGQGWICSGEAGIFERVNFPRISTYDNSGTPTGDLADRKVVTAAIDVAQLRAIVGDAVVEAEANDPKALKAEIAKLRKQIANSSVAAAPRGVSEAEVKRRIEEAVTNVPYIAPDPVISAALVKAIDQIAAGAKAAVDELAAAGSREMPRVARVLPRPTPVELPALKPDKSPKPTYGNMIPPLQSAGDLKAPEQRIVDAIAWWDAAGVEWPSRHQVAFVAGYTVNGHFNNQVGTLRGRGLIDYPSGGTLCITNNGRMFARSPGAKPTRGELVARVLAVLKTEPMRRVFGVLVDRGALSRQDLAEAAGYTVNGHFNNIVGSLSGVGLVDYPTKGSVSLTSIFEGLR